ncbi:glycine betaine ABC transporter substrate-binding protein [Allobaculum sp. JKK-2023]|uniref:glycine betaine ABC transporter substrate-binding protein n=1 Tax=Allobaculum sp. JKK-2023 TaxID=3108943 RepID=UPI002B062013|nr:glycine betaine ABC transporter substrate-binding protein [Allobaculum sp. JKK-2023]
MRRVRKYAGLLMSFVLSLSLFAGCADEHVVRVGVSDEAHIQIIGYMVRELAARKGIECQIRQTGSGIASLQPALESDCLQVGIEFTEAAWRNVLQKKDSYHAGDLGLLQSEYKKLGLSWYNLPQVKDHYTLAISRRLMLKENIHTLSELLKIDDQLTIGAPTIFFEDSTGYPYLQSEYGFDFASTSNLPEDGLVEELLDQKIDVIPAHSVDGYVNKAELVILEDDLGVREDMTAGIVITKDALKEYPELAQIAKSIAAVLTDGQLAALAGGVTSDLFTAQQAAMMLLKAKNLVAEKPMSA